MFLSERVGLPTIATENFAMHAQRLYRRWVRAVGVLIAIAMLSPLAIAEETAVSEAQNSETIDFERDVASVLERRCAGCHIGERAKGGFQLDDRDTVLTYVEPGDTESSLLWTDYLKAESAHVDPATTVMPLNGPLPTHELEIVEDWIEQGAIWPENFRFVSTAGIPAIEREPVEPEGVYQRISAFLGYFHPPIVHFPIGLLVFGAAAAALSFITGGRAIYVAYYCLVWGAFSSIVAAYMGWCFAAEKGYPNWSTVPTSDSIEAASAIFRHRWLGTFSAFFAVIVLVLATIALRKPKSVLRHVWRIGFLILALVISIAGHQGGELVYGDILGKAFERLLGK